MAIKKLILKADKLPKFYYVRADVKKDETVSVVEYNAFRRKRVTTIFGSKLHLKPADASMRSIFAHVPFTQTEGLPTITDRKLLHFEGNVFAYAQHYLSTSGNNSVRTLLFADDIVSDDKKIVHRGDIKTAEQLLDETVELTDLSILRGTSLPLTSDIVDIKKTLGSNIEFMGFNREDYVRNSRTGELDLTQVESRSYDVFLNDLNLLISVKVLNDDEVSEYTYNMFDKIELVEPEFTAYAVNNANFGFAIKCKALKLLTKDKEDIKQQEKVQEQHTKK